MNKAKSFNVELSNEVVRQINNIVALKEDGVSFDALIVSLVERGLKDMIYRTQRNARVWEQTKAMKARLVELEEKEAK